MVSYKEDKTPKRRTEDKIPYVKAEPNQEGFSSLIDTVQQFRINMIHHNGQIAQISSRVDEIKEEIAALRKDHTPRSELEEMTKGIATIVFQEHCEAPLNGINRNISEIRKCLESLKESQNLTHEQSTKNAALIQSLDGRIIRTETRVDVWSGISKTWEGRIFKTLIFLFAGAITLLINLGGPALWELLK